MIRIFNSLVEALTYGLLVLVILFNVLVLVTTISTAQQIKRLTVENTANTKEIEKQQRCFASFFLQQNRGNITLANLGICSDVVKETK